jgi:hypothetical protein
MRLNKKRGILYLVLIVALLINSASGYLENLSVISKQRYFLGETVKINLSKFSNIGVRIITSQNIYEQMGSLEKELPFNPRSVGNYSLELFNVSSSRALGRYNFSVILSEQIDSSDVSNLIAADTNAQPEKSNELASINIYPTQDMYDVGQNLFIDLSNIPVNYSLYISSNESTYQFMGELKNRFNFMPKKEGNYEIQITNEHNELVHLKNFNVGKIPWVIQDALISTDKTDYLLGEDVNILLHYNRESNYTITVNSNNETYKYLGVTNNNLRFVPRNQGSYIIELRDKDRIIQIIRFLVQLFNEQYIPMKRAVRQMQSTKNISTLFSINSSIIKGSTYEIIALQNGIPINDVESNKRYDVEIVAQNAPIEKITFKNLNITEKLNLGIDTVSKELVAPPNAQVMKVYAIDPSQLNFTEAVVTSVATGHTLWKCKDWNYTTQDCYGTWEKLMDISPGKEYSFTLTSEDPGYAETGVASVNTNKSIYHPGEPAKIIMVVLNTKGYLVSNARVFLNVTSPANSITVLSTDSNTILETGRGIYEAIYVNTEQQGNYTLEVSALGKNVNNSMNSYFVVKDFFEFDILRSTPVTIDPWKAVVTSTIRLSSYVDTHIFSFNEVLPESFTVTDDGGAFETVQNNMKILTWNNLINNSVISYSTQPPLITPELYEIGLSYISYASNTFTEARPWYLAVDPAGTANAMIIYGDDPASTTTFTRIYSGGVWDNPIADGLTGVPQWIIARANKRKPEVVAGVMNTSGSIFASVWNGTNWTNTLFLANLNTARAAWRGFDVAIETQRGNAMVFYANRSTVGRLAYRIWNGNSWSNESSFSIVSNANLSWVRAEPNPAQNSNEISIAVSTNNTVGTPDVYAVIWNGTALTNNRAINLTGSDATTQFFDVAYDNRYNYSMFVLGGSTSQYLAYTQWNGTTWKLNGTFTISTFGATVRWVKLTSDPSSVSIMLTASSGNSEISTRDWNGTAWNAIGHIEHDSGAETALGRCFDFVWTNFSGTQMGLLAYGAGADAIGYKNWSPSSKAWTGEATYDPAGSWTDHRVIQMAWDETEKKVWYLDADDGGGATADVNYAQYQLGGGWNSYSEITGSISCAAYKECFFIVPTMNWYRADLPPNITALNYPGNNSLITVTPIDFNFTVVDMDDDIIANCTLWTNFTGTWQPNVTIYNVLNATITNITVAPDDGRYIWNIKCIDDTNLSDWYDFNFTVNVSAPPDISGSVTNDGPVVEGSTITFTGSCSNPGDYFRLIVCNSTASYCNSSTSSQQIICQGINSTSTTPSCSLITNTSYAGTHINDKATCCDDRNLCDATPVTIDNWVVKGSPRVSVQPSDQGSSSTSPTTAPDPVVFTVTATDPNEDKYYLLICPTNVTDGGSCEFGYSSYCVSDQVNSGAQATCSPTSTLGKSGNYNWYAFACDNTTDILCSIGYNSTGTTGSPFYINNKPTWTNVYANVSYAKQGSSIRMYTIDASDLENDNIRLQCGNQSGVYGSCQSGFGQPQRNCSFIFNWNDNAPHTIYCILNDSFSVSAQNATNITADNLNPSIINPQINDSDQIVRRTDTLKLNITATDSGSGVANVSAFNVSTVYLYRIGTSYVWEINTSGNSFGCIQTNSNCTIHFTVKDSAGNINDSVIYQITIDEVNPSVTNPGINDTDRIIKSTHYIRLNVTVTDTNSITNVTVANESIVQMYPIASTNYWYVNTTAASLGCTQIDSNCTLHYTAVDVAGNTNNSVLFQVTIDDKNPSVTNVKVNDTDNKVRSTYLLNISAIITDTNGVYTVTVNSTNLIRSSNTWYTLNRTPDFGCGEGSCLLLFTAIDNLGNINNSELLNITVDDTPPNIQLVAPINYYNTSSSTVNFNFSATDNIDNNITCNITIDGRVNNTQPLNVTNGSYANYSVAGFIEGNHSWNMTCWDDIPNQNRSLTRNFTVDLSPPNVSLESPANNTRQTASNTVIFRYNVTDIISTVANCSLILNRVVDGPPNPEVQEGTSLNFTRMLANGLYNWSVNCTDSVGRTGSSKIYNLTVQVTADSEAPVITLNNPDNYYNSTSGNISFYYTPFDALSGIANCTLIINGTRNTTNSSPVIESQQNNINVTRIPEGFYYWTINCTDNSTNRNQGNASNGPRLFNVRYPAPTVNLESPSNGTSYPSAQNVIFKYNVSYNTSALANCTLIINNNINQTNTTVRAYTSQNFTQYLPSGTYNWSVNCTDMYRRQGASITNIVIISPPKYIYGVSPIDASQVDRDSVNPSVSDNITLVIKLSDNANGQSVDFYANLTDPNITTEKNILLGTAISNASGHAALNFSGRNSVGNKIYAGNYTWWGVSGIYVLNGTRTVLAYGGLNVSFRFIDELPSLYYGKNSTLRIQEFLRSLGPESDSQLNNTYNASVNTTLVAPNGTNYTIALVDPDIFEADIETHEVCVYESLSAQARDINTLPTLKSDVAKVNSSTSKNISVSPEKIKSLEQKREKLRLRQKIADSKERNIDARLIFYDTNGSLIQDIKKSKGLKGILEKIGLASLPSLYVQNYSVDLIPEKSHVKNIRFRNVEYTGSFELGLDHLEGNTLRIRDMNYVRAFALDPTRLNFSEATVTLTAAGNVLWKCIDWNFSEQKCYGTWQRIMDIVPGVEYSFTLTPEDPGYAETGVASVNTNKSLYHPGETALISTVVLDKDGYLVSNADVTLSVINPENETSSYSTEERTLQQIQHGIYNAIYYAASIEGNYSLVVQAIGENVNSTMFSYFVVKDYYEFDILRNAPMTTDPWISPFSSSAIIVSYTGSKKFDYYEILPTDFTITDSGNATIEEEDGKKKLIWKNLENNSVIEYRARPPLLTPMLYELGPSYISYGSEIFTEARPWYLAVDPHVAKLYDSFEDQAEWDFWSETGGGFWRVDNGTGTNEGITCINGTYCALVDACTLHNCMLTLSDPINLSTYSDAELSFYRWVDNQFDSGIDFLEVDVYYNGSWHMIYNWTIGDDTWNREVWDIGANNALDGAFKVRFHGGGNGALEDALIDAINITAWNVYPNVTNLTYPYNRTIINVTPITFNFTAVDNYAPITNCTLWTNFTGSWQANKTVFNVRNGTVTNITIAPDDGFYIWNIECFNLHGLSDFYNSNYSVNVSAPPDIFTNVSHSGNVTEGNNITFSANCTNQGDTFRLLICNASASYCNASTPSALIMCNGTNSASADLNRSCMLATNNSYAGPHIGDKATCCDDWNQCDSVSVSVQSWEVYSPPTIIADLSDNGSSQATPTLAGNVINFSVTAKDPNADTTYKLLVCNTSSRNGLECASGALKYCEAFASDNTQTSCTYPFTSGKSGNYSWWAFVCDNSDYFLCSLAANGTGTTGSPFYINNKPALVNITASSYVAQSSQQITITTVTAQDSENDILRLQCGNETGNYNLCAGAYGAGERSCIFYSPWTDDTAHTVYCVLNDSFSVSGENTTTIEADNTAPSVFLLAPGNNSFDTDGSVSFNYSYADVHSASACQLWINLSGWSAYATQYNPQPTQVNTLGPYSLSDGVYAWNIRCNDSVNNIAFNNTNYTITIDTNAPSIALISPPNGDIKLVSTIQFYYQVDDLSNISNCSLIINNQANGSSSYTVTKGNPNEFFERTLDDGTYFWSVNCTDIHDFSSNSTTWNLTINAVDEPPSATLNYPQPDMYSNSQNLIFSYNASDDSGLKNCSLFLNALLNQSNSTSVSFSSENYFTVNNIPEGSYNWTVECIDLSEQVAQPSARTFHIDLTSPQVPFLSPENGFTFNESDRVPFRYIVTDAIGAEHIENCSLFINNSLRSIHYLIDKGTQDTFIEVMANGFYLWNITCYDSAGNYNHSETYSLWVNSSLKIWNNSFDLTNQLEGIWNLSTYGSAKWFYTVSLIGTRNFTLDKSAPNITLISPSNNYNTTETTNAFIYNVTDRFTNIINCSLIVDNLVVRTNYSVTQLSPNNFTYALSYGTHTWQVNCTDYLGNPGNSSIYTINIRFKDLTLNGTHIIFSRINPVESEAVNINATIFNIGTEDITDNFYVRFFDGDPDLGGIQINGDLLVIGLNAQSNKTLNVSWTASIGTHNIFVIIDATGVSTESNESNNRAYNTSYINAYNIYYGESFARFYLDTALNFSVYSWLNGTNFSANIFVVDSDNINGISWTYLKALSRNLTGDLKINDFNDIDIALNMTAFNDSINKTYTINNNLRASKNITLYGMQINNTPVVNSTITSAFVTGILWDSADLNSGEYNGSQDIVFVTQVNSSSLGLFGVYDYEIKVPALLREYVKPNNDNTVTFYTELT